MSMHPSHKVPCRKCGYQVDSGASVCGNCGSPMSSKLFGRSTSPAQATAIPRGIIAFLVLIGLVGGAALLLREPIAGLIDEAREVIDGGGGEEQPFVAPNTEGGETEGSGKTKDPDKAKGPKTTKGYAHVKDLVRDLNRGGLDCSQAVVDAHDESISTGSCLASGTHVQINIYLFPPSLEGASESFRDSPFTYVHKQNWFVITQDSVAREVKRILGGRLHRG